MKQRLLPAVLTAALVVPATGRATADAEIQRTVYFSALDAKGVHVTDLAAGDLAVKEGGKDVVIRGVEPATAPLQVSLLIDDGGSGAFQPAVTEFVRALYGRALFAIRVMNPQPSTLTDFTTDSVELKRALNGLGPRGRVYSAGEQIIDAVGEAARELRQRGAPRPAIVVISVLGEQVQSDQADAALDALRLSGASLSVLNFTGVRLGQVLGDGPKRSGGMIQQVGPGVVPIPMLVRIADNLLHQYALTYALPYGVKASDKLSLTTSRKGVTLLTPTRIPDKAQ